MQCLAYITSIVKRASLVLRKTGYLSVEETGYFSVEETGYSSVEEAEQEIMVNWEWIIHNLLLTVKIRPPDPSLPQPPSPSPMSKIGVGGNPLSNSLFKVKQQNL